ncbi:helix-turn-helix domain-containing protein [Nonomuraea thailandensis]
MDRSAELSEFLKSRRARLRPEEVGVPYRSNGTRRVRGLRREELALLAGVSVTHYTRLEQGRSQNVSAEVLDAIADVLRLTGDERAYLHALAHPAHRCRDFPGRRYGRGCNGCSTPSCSPRPSSWAATPTSWPGTGSPPPCSPTSPRSPATAGRSPT